MKTVLKYVFTSVLLIGLIGCGSSESKSSETSESIRVSVKIPTSENKSSQGDTQQFKSFQSAVNSVLLQVHKNGDDSLLNTKAMTKGEDGVWTVDLILNPDNAPFKFKASAYEEEDITPNTSLADVTPIFTGETQAVADGADAELILEETVESIADSIRTLPSLVSVVSAVQNDESINLTFNLANENADTITYELSSKNGDDEECTTLFSDISASTVTFPAENSFTATLTLNEESCPNAKHYLKMTNTVNDSVNVLFTADYSSSTVSIVLPSVITNVAVTDEGTSFTLEVSVDGSTDGLSYEWTVLDGVDGTLGSSNTSSTSLIDCNRDNALKVSIKVTNNAGASTTLHYELIASSEVAVSDPVKKTGQIKSYDVGGSEVTNNSLKDDGFYEKGVAPSYKKNPDETVTDNVRGLIWVDSAASKTDTYTHANAITHCEGLDFAGSTEWRLPTRKELGDIVDWSKVEPSIDDAFFNNTASNKYWSSTTNADGTNTAWYVNFDNGSQNNDNKNNNNYVRCVRAGE